MYLCRTENRSIMEPPTLSESDTVNTFTYVSLKNLYASSDDDLKALADLLNEWNLGELYEFFQRKSAKTVQKMFHIAFVYCIDFVFAPLMVYSQNNIYTSEFWNICLKKWLGIFLTILIFLLVFELNCSIDGRNGSKHHRLQISMHRLRILMYHWL